MRTLNNINGNSARNTSRLAGVIAAVLGVMLLIWFASLRNPQPAFAHDAKFYLECPQTWVREGESVDVFMVRESDHQHNVGFFAYWYTEEGTAHGIFDFHEEDGVHQHTTSEEKEANRMRHTVQTKDGIVLEQEESFIVRFAGDEYAVDMNDPARDNQCEIAIIDDDLQITSIEMVSSPSRGDTYGLGETIQFAANFSHEVEVRGPVLMGMWISGDWRGAAYQSGSGTDRLVFGYEVQPDDFDGDGISVHDGYVDPDGTRHGIGGRGVIVEPHSSGAQASPWYAGIWDQSGHKVDGSRAPRPTWLLIQKPADGHTYWAGEEIRFWVKFSAPVRVLNTPHASLWFDGTGESVWRGARYQSGSGTNELAFSYLVKPGDMDTDGILVGAKDERGYGEGKIKALNHDVDAIHTHGEWRLDHNVDGNIYVTGVSMASTPADGETYRYGESIEIDVSFNIPVRAVNNPFIGLWLEDSEGSKANYPTYSGGSGTKTLRFSYEVMPGDLDADGLLVASLGPEAMGTGKALALNHDWEADHSFEGREFPNHKVNGNIEVTDVSIMSSPASGDTYRFGESIEVDVTFSAPVRAVDNPMVSLWFGEAGDALWKGAQYQSGSGTNTLRFAYEVGVEDKDEDGILIGAIERHGLGEGKVLALNHDAEANHTYGAQFLEGHKVSGQPYVRDVQITSTPALGGTIYGQGEIVEITVYFDQAVEKDGEVKLALDISYPEDQSHFASYVSGDGSDAFVFEYEVLTDDWDEDGIGIVANGESSGFAGSGSIKAVGSEVELDSTYHGLSDIEAHKVNGGSLYLDRSNPRIKSVGIVTDPGDDEIYSAGDQIVVAVTFNEPVSVFGVPQLPLNIGEEERTAAFWDRSFTERDIGLQRDVDRMGMERTVLLAYTVQEGDFDDDGVSIGANALSLNGGTIWDKIGNHADLVHEALAEDGVHRVDAPDMTGPVVSSIAIVSDPGEDGAYGIGDEIRVAVTFNEAIIVSGIPQLQIEIGATTGIAEFESSEGATAFFSYTVAEGDEAPEGIGVVDGSLGLYDVAVEDIFGNVSELVHEAVEADIGHPVDGVRPAFVIAETSEDGAEVIVTFSEEVTLSPVLLSLGEAVGIAPSGLIRAFVLLNVDGRDVVASDARLSGDILTLVLPTEVWEGQKVEVAFKNVFQSQSISIFVDSAGNGMEDFASEPVANLSTGLEIQYSTEAAPAVVVSDTHIDMQEGESLTYTVALSMKPSDEVMVNITRTPLSREAHAPLSLPFLTMYFTPENWFEPQEVTIEAENDEDDHDHVIFLTHTALGGGYHLETQEILVTITDSN